MRSLTLQELRNVPFIAAGLIELQKAPATGGGVKAKPYGHTEYMKHTKLGKLVHVAAKGAKPGHGPTWKTIKREVGHQTKHWTADHHEQAFDAHLKQAAKHANMPRGMMDVDAYEHVFDEGRSSLKELRGRYDPEDWKGKAPTPPSKSHALHALRHAHLAGVHEELGGEKD